MDRYQARKLDLASVSMVLLELMPGCPPPLWRPVALWRWLRCYRAWRHGGAVRHAFLAYHDLLGILREDFAADDAGALAPFAGSRAMPAERSAR